MTDRDPLARARALTRLLDSAAKIPGTGIRFGLDPVLGVVPGLGDVCGAALAGYLVLLAQRLGAPRAVVLRMLTNVAVDTACGTVPVLGDAFDVAFKSSTRNLALLERALESPTQTGRASKLLVAGSLLALSLLAIGGIVVAVLVVRSIARAVQG
jgi:Domain of unknown function (DUF4112)